MYKPEAPWNNWPTPFGGYRYIGLFKCAFRKTSEVVFLNISKDTTSKILSIGWTACTFVVSCAPRSKTFVDWSCQDVKVRRTVYQVIEGISTKF